MENKLTPRNNFCHEARNGIVQAKGLILKLRKELIRIDRAINEYAKKILAGRN